MQHWIVLGLLCLPLFGQNSGVLAIQHPERVHAKRGEALTEHLSAELPPGFHVNSNAPADEYLIPLKLTWGKGPLEVEQVVYPQPQFVHLAFSQKPVSIFSGKFEIATKFKTPASAAPGITFMNGKLRYQACNDKECLPPKTVDVQFGVDVQ